jgi:ethanolamine ammonia-lyase large subunit
MHPHAAPCLHFHWQQEGGSCTFPEFPDARVGNGISERQIKFQMARWSCTVAARTHQFGSLQELMAKATPRRSGDELAGVAAASAEERVAAQLCLADVPLREFLEEPLVPYEIDEVTRLIVDTHDRGAFAPVAGLTVGQFREWLLRYETDSAALTALAPGLTPEMAAATAKLMSNQDLILAAQKCRVITAFRSTIGLPGRLSVRLQPNHPTDNPQGITASIIDGLLYGCGDAVIGINPATDSVSSVVTLLKLIDDLVRTYRIPTQSCVLAHVTTQLEALRLGAPVDLIFQSVAGTEAANKSFGVNLALLAEAREAALSLRRGTVGQNVMYFETGQGSALSAGANHGLDQQTCEARAYAVARRFQPLLVNTVVGFIGPEYLYDGKQIIRAGLEDHFCGKLLGLPMGVDVCYTNHAEADQDDMDTLLTLLGVAGCNYIMGVPGADDIMLGYQSTSFHDSHYLRQVLGLRPAPEFEEWLQNMRIAELGRKLQPVDASHALLAHGPS